MGGDMISRSDIMGRLKRLELNQTKGEVIKGINAAAFVVETAPDAEPEECCPAGWIISEVRCPHCLEYFDTDTYTFHDLIKCPNCGKDNRQEGGGDQ